MLCVGNRVSRSHKLQSLWEAFELLAKSLITLKSMEVIVRLYGVEGRGEKYKEIVE